MIDIFKTNLHLFDGDGGASGAPASGEGAQAATPATSQQDNGETAQPAVKGSGAMWASPPTIERT